MKLSEFVTMLQRIQTELGQLDPPVALADWGEDYESPSEWAAQSAYSGCCKYKDMDGRIVKDNVVIIGGN